MNPTEHQLIRLFRAATQRPEAAIPSPSAEWIAACCATLPGHASRPSEAASLIYAVGAACLVMLASLGWHYSSQESLDTQALMIADTAIQLTLAE